MIQKVKEIISELTGIDDKNISTDMHIRDDLHIDEYEIEELLEEVGAVLNIEFDDKDSTFVYLSDLIAFIKEAM